MPRKLGQHFLASQSILEQLADAACGSGTPRVIEIGPGRGALTRHLLLRTDELHAIELDERLAAVLKTQFAGEPKLHVHHGDVLHSDLSQWGPAVIAGNLPYYITSPIVEKFLRLPSSFSSAVFLMQLEVAERIIAGPGTRDYGYLSVAVQVTCEIELVCKVPPGAFSPPPKVDSAAVRFVRRADSPEHPEAFLQFVGRCFAHKRKTLRNNLKPFFGSAIDNQPEAGLRAEQLSVEALAALHKRLLSYTEAS